MDATDIAGGDGAVPTCASWIQRFAALLLDSIFYVAFLVIGGFVLSFAVLLAQGGDGEFTFQFDGWLAVLALGAPWALWEYAWLRSRRGAKPGQRIAGFRVVDLAGRRLTRGRAIARVAMRAAHVALPPMWLASAVLIGNGPRHQGVHDLVVGSMCVTGAGVPGDDPTGRTPDAPTAVSHEEHPQVAATRPLAEDDRHRGPFL